MHKIRSKTILISFVNWANIFAEAVENTK